jgi:hypothetical protein
MARPIRVRTDGPRVGIRWDGERERAVARPLEQGEATLHSKCVVPAEDDSPALIRRAAILVAARFERLMALPAGTVVIQAGLDRW